MTFHYISLFQHTTLLHISFRFSSPALSLVRNYFSTFEMCQEILISPVLLKAVGQSFTTNFLLSFGSRKQPFQLSTFLSGLVS